MGAARIPALSCGMYQRMLLGLKRKVIVHNHLFKNAGSTIDWALQKNFGKDFIDHRDDDEMRKGAAYLGGFLQQHRAVRAISSHHLTLPLPEISGLQLLKIMMLRHPVERVISVYSFEQKQTEATTPGSIKARELDLRDYILWRMDPKAGATIRNFHVRKMLPPREIGKEAISDAEMADAARFAGSIEMLGLVNRFDESMVLFEHSLKAHFRNIDLAYVIQNVGQDPSHDRGQRIGRLKTEIGDDVFELLIQNNRRDLEMYAWAENEFKRRIAAVPDFAKRLDGFRARCAKLAAEEVFNCAGNGD